MGPNNQFFGIKVSKQGIPVDQASDKQLILKDDFSTRIYYDDTDARVALGKLPDGTYGLWVSKPGEDVLDASGDQLIFNSGQNVFKIVDSITLDMSFTLDPVNPKYVSMSEAHGITTYVPAMLAYITLDSNLSAAAGYTGSAQVPNPFTLIDTSGVPSLTPLGYFVVTIDSTNVNFEVTIVLTGVATYDLSAKVYILQETFN